MAKLSDRIKAFLNPTPAQQPEVLGSGPAPVISDSLVNRFSVERSRAAVVRDCRAMYDGDPRVEKMHTDLARDVLRGGFVVLSKDQRVKQILTDMQERLKLVESLEVWIRLSARDGDSFLELELASLPNGNYGIADVTRKPTLQMHRNSNTRDRFDDPQKAFWMGDDMWMGSEPPQDAIWFPVWKMVHARWKHDAESRYGRPMMKSARKQYKFVEEGELNVAVRRKAGGAQLRQHVIEGGPADVEKYKEDNKASFGKLAAVLDFFSNKKSSLTVTQGDGNIDKIDDVKHNIATMFTASEKPMELMGYGDGLSRDILDPKKDSYEETLRQDREWTVSQILGPLFEMELLLNGILPASVKYQIIWRKAKNLTPTELRDLADAGSRLRILGMKEDAVNMIMASYLADVDIDILQGDGLSSADFANNLKGISI